MNEMITLKKRVEVFLEKSIPAHIILKNDTWLNGYILKVYDDYLDFLDRKQGKLPIFFVDIYLFDFFKGDFKTLKEKDENNTI
jgi:hypothetical protein